MPLNVRSYSDINLNWTIHPIKHDLTKVTGKDSVIQSLKLLLATDNFEVPFHPEIGSNIRALLFENITSINTAILKNHIDDTIRNFEPRVQIETIEVIPDYTRNGYIVNILFYIKNLTDPVQITTFLSKAR
jgi:phage baseplate assembly protein W